MREAEIENFEKAEAQLQGLHEEIGILSKKRPDKAVNGWKLKFVNKILEKANGILEERYRPFGGFEAIGGLTNSDVVMMSAGWLPSIALSAGQSRICEGIKKINFFKKRG
jgi:hypothetical protein